MRPVVGAVLGLLFGVFLALDLFMVKAYNSDSPMFLVLPIVGLVLGIALGLYGRHRRAARL